MKNVEDIYPLSPMQQGLLFHSLYETGSGLYVEQLSFTLREGLNAGAFEQAWREVIARHTILRTAFVWEGLDEPLQVVRQTVDVSVARHDWRELTAEMQREQFDAFMLADRQRGFDLSEAPLLRLTLMRLTEKTYRFVWSTHQMVVDGWSLFLVLKEALALYEAISQGRDSRILKSRPFRDYIAWLQQQELSEAGEFWRKLLRGFTTPTSLIPVRASRLAPSPRQATDAKQQVHLNSATTSALQNLARQQRLTLNTLAEGAWAVLLSRYSGEEDVVFGVTMSGRPATLDGIEEMAGAFINTLPLRVRVADDETLLPWLHNIQARLAELRRYEYSPLVEVQGWSEVGRGQPLFDSILAFENYPVEVALREQVNRLGIGDVHFSAKTNYPITVVIVPGERLLLEINYDSGRFDMAVVRQIARHYESLLESFVKDPAQKLSDLSLLTQAEREQVLFEWNRQQADYPIQQPLQVHFERRAELTPDAPALTFEGRQISYRELNARANQLARYLRRRGVGAEVRVGICVKRSVELVVGLLGILKAGGAFVPLDAAYPPERLKFMLEDAQLRVVVTQLELTSHLPASAGEVVCLDADWSGIGEEDAANLDAVSTSSSLAYVIYTSGSTGWPKGVMIEHRSLMNYLYWVDEHLLGDAVERMPVTTRLTFDASLKQIFAPLLRGGCVWMVSDEWALEPGKMLEALMTGGRVGFNCVPSLWKAMLELVESGRYQGSLDTLTSLFVGGEQLGRELMNRTFAALPHLRMWNLYGPTEATANASAALCEPRAVPHIGRPIANSQIYLLDERLEPVAIGIPGHLYIGGINLARGYLNRPELTAEKFIPNPFGAEAGARLYHSGDLARYLPGGEIEYLGRDDGQVKVRGFRVELGEIEVTLSHHPAVEEVLVMAHDVQDGDKRLVAYVVAGGDRRTLKHELRSFLKQKLPEHLWPSSILLLDALPLTLTGKIDRQALSAMSGEPEAEAGEVYVAPQSPVEEMLAGIWSEILGVGRVGQNDDFFELGGHSLLAMQLMSRVREAFSTEVGLGEIFENPTLAAFARRVESLLREGAKTSLPPLTRVSREQPLALSFAQQRLWFIHQIEPDSPVNLLPAAVRIIGALDLAALEKTFNEIIRRHESLRTSFAVFEGQPVQVIAPAAHLELPLVDLSALAQDERDERTRTLMREETRHPFDLSKWPLMRMKALKLSAQEHIVLLTMHHVISDGWSNRVLISEVAALYDAFTQGRPSPLVELPVQYADFSVWQRNWLQGDALEKQLSYWREHLAGAPTVLELPTDRPRPVSQIFPVASEPVKFSSGLTGLLKELSRREGATLFMTLLTVFQLLLARYSGQDDIVVGLPTAGRSRAETETLIGFFVNTLVLRTRVDGNQSFDQLLRDVRNNVLQAFAHQDVPFEKLVEELQPDRSLNHNPLFQVMLAVQSALPQQESLKLSGLQLSLVEVEHAVATLDLALILDEVDDGLSGSMKYRSDIFEAATIRRMISHFEMLLESVVAQPSSRISRLSLLTPDERRQLLAPPEALVTPEQSATVCLHELFEAQVARTPEAIALSFEEQQVSYGELNRRANHLAHRLRALGVGPDVLVGLLTERSVDMIIGLLGILKAGGAYLPLDPASPRERLAYMLSDAAVEVLVTQRHLLPEGMSGSICVICPGEEEESHDGHSRENPGVGMSAANLAYVIYTSGSTGQPKGVLIPHRNVTSLFAATRPLFRFDHADVWTLFHSYAFDFSVWELWGALLHGARLVLVPYLTQPRPGSLPPPARRRARDRPQPDARGLPPTDAGRRGGTGRRAAPAAEARSGALSLRVVVFGGEALEFGSLRGWVARHGAARPRLVNMYGITETTVHVTYRAVGRGDVEGGAGSLIGAGIAGWEVYVLDAELEPVPEGVAGEVYVGGAGLARGYLGRAGLTAERFIPHPYSAGGGARLYRTGDVGRRVGGGEVEYVGRADRQVKVRGFRIEVGEIEAALNDHEGVQEAVVVPSQHAPGDTRLIAYLVPHAQRALPVRQLLRLKNTGAINGHHQLELPNGMTVIALANTEEAKFIYKEIFEEEIYLRHGVSLPDGACIFDVGANIGLFTLFAGSRCQNATIYAFEPLPPIFEALRLNASLYGLDVRLYGCGLADKARDEVFTYYPNFPGSSGRFGDPDKDREILQRGLVNVLQLDPAESSTQQATEEFETLMRERLAGRLVSERVTCQLRTISDVMRENNVQRIDLLKVDAEKSEMDVLAGIEADDWHKIEQIVLEVHDLEGRLEEIRGLLRSHDFEVAVEQDAWLSDTGLYNVYAVRSARGPTASDGMKPAPPARLPHAWSSAAALTADIRRFMKERLPEYMVPASYILLDALPLTANDKLDLEALPAPDDVRPDLETSFVAPHTPVEKALAELWREILDLKQVGIHDNFFDLGGHSLLLTQLASRIRQVFQVDLPLRMLFDAPTISDMTTAIAERQLEAEDGDDVTQMLQELQQLSPAEISELLKQEEASAEAGD